jgi:hypothetical protein
MWGWIAWQIDPEKAFPLVEGYDRDRVAPGGDVVRELLTKGAGGRAWGAGPDIPLDAPS